ncbi:MAG: hypothetical protein ABWX84_03305 [Nocardioides sp.]
MISTTLTAEIAHLQQAELRAAAGRWSLARLFRRDPEPAPGPAPTYGGVTAVPVIPQPRRALDEHVHDHAA